MGELDLESTIRELRQLEARVDQLKETQSAILSERTISDVLKVAAEQLASQGYQEITIALVRRHGAQYFLESMMKTEVDDQGRIQTSKGSYGEEVRLGAGIGATCILTEQPYHIRDPQRDIRVNQATLDPRITEYYATPLVVRDPADPITIEGREKKSIGILNIRYRDANRHFSEYEKKYLDVVAGMVGNALNNSILRDRLQEEASRDSLTGLYNRRFFIAKLEEEVKRAGRHNRPLSLVYMDLDGFKGYNDSKGHVAGDAALEIVASLICDTFRSMDIPARYGGDEFVVLAPETDAGSLRSAAERLRSRVQETFSKMNANITLSIGIADYVPKMTSDGFVTLADQQMYESKKSGGNRISIAPSNNPSS